MPLMLPLEVFDVINFLSAINNQSQHDQKDYLLRFDRWEFEPVG